MKNSGKTALAGVLAALAVTVMALGTVVPVGTFCCPMLCILLSIPILDVCGTGWLVGWYTAVGILSMLLAPDREAAAVFVFFGLYPAARPFFEKLRPRLLRVVLKLVLFNLLTAGLYGLLIFVIGMPSVTEEFRQTSSAILLVTLALGNVTFLIFDLLYGRMALLWKHKWKKRLIKNA